MGATGRGSPAPTLSGADAQNGNCNAGIGGSNKNERQNEQKGSEDKNHQFCLCVVSRGQFDDCWDLAEELVDAVEAAIRQAQGKGIDNQRVEEATYLPRHLPLSSCRSASS